MYTSTFTYHTRVRTGNSSVSIVVSFDLCLLRTQYLSAGGRHPQQGECDDCSSFLVAPHARPQESNVRAQAHNSCAIIEMYSDCQQTLHTYCTKTVNWPKTLVYSLNFMESAEFHLEVWFHKGEHQVQVNAFQCTTNCSHKRRVSLQTPRRTQCM